MIYYTIITPVGGDLPRILTDPNIGVSDVEYLPGDPIAVKDKNVALDLIAGGRYAMWQPPIGGPKEKISDSE